MTAVTSHSSAAELEGRYKTVGDPFAKSQFHATWLLARNFPIDEVTELLLRRCGTWVTGRDTEPDTTVFSGISLFGRGPSLRPGLQLDQAVARSGGHP